MSNIALSKTETRPLTEAAAREDGLPRDPAHAHVGSHRRAASREAYRGWRPKTVDGSWRSFR